MNSKLIMEKLTDIFRDVFGDDELIISEGTNSSDIEGWDSLMHINILAAVQDEFKVSFKMDEIVEMKNVGDMVNAIMGKINE